MKKAVYIITNKLNGKKYVGQSKSPERRFKEHCRGNTGYISIISRAISKYGEDNFTFEVVGWYDDYLEKERELIASHRTLVPNGYNIQAGGEDSPLWEGENHPLAMLSQKTVDKIQYDLIHDWDLRDRDLREKYGLTVDQLRHIREGSSWRKDGLQYPLRPGEEEIDRMRADEVIHLLKTTTLSQKKIGAQVGWQRSAVTMINIGKNHFRADERYPIR